METTVSPTAAVSVPVALNTLRLLIAQYASPNAAWPHSRFDTPSKCCSADTQKLRQNQLVIARSYERSDRVVGHKRLARCKALCGSRVDGRKRWTGRSEGASSPVSAKRDVKYNALLLEMRRRAKPFVRPEECIRPAPAAWVWRRVIDRTTIPRSHFCVSLAVSRRLVPRCALRSAGMCSRSKNHIFFSPE